SVRRSSTKRSATTGQGQLIVRKAVRRDAPAIAKLGRELNRHQKEPTRYFTLTAILKDGFGRVPQFQCLIAELNGKSVGYALMVPAYETGWAARGLYINDLHVTASARGKGVGRALVAACAAFAKQQKKTFRWWASKSWNKQAQAFYKGLGAIHEPVVAHALTFDSFEALAKEGAISRGRRKSPRRHK
ncbi:MAG: GNAT family N-acetyltransferase, partial [Rhodospirillaceae bacterium]